MLMQTRAPVLERAGLWPFVGAWLLACAILIAAAMPMIRAGIFPDPDDALRLLEVRAWLAGQSWFDITQYRMNLPAGGSMHWSRLVDVPIGGAILLFKPFIGQARAEIVAAILIPLLTLGLVMAAVASIAQRLLDREHALLACLLTPVSLSAVQQLRPLRIDHHGWQIALGLAATLAALDDNRRRSGLIAGAAAALWLQISLEGLPLAVAVAALFGLRWVLDPREAPRLRAFVLALAGLSFVLFALTKSPSAWSVPWCDSISEPYLGALAVGAAGSLIALAISPASPVWRGIALAFAGALGAGAALLIDPACSHGPFQALDPLVERIWYRNIAEGLPVWKQSAAAAALLFAFPVVGLIGTIRAAATKPTRRTAWLSLLFLLGAALAIGLMVQRGAAIANLLALPGGVFLLNSALARARALSSLPLRLAGLAAAVALVIPGYILGGVALALTGDEGKNQAVASMRECVDARELSLLNRLPPSNLAAPLDIGPAVLLHSHHTIIASGHHRNAAAMHDVIEIFTGSPAVARQRLEARHIGYLIACPALIEVNIYSETYPNGLWAQLDRGITPDWLVPVRLGGSSPLRVWRVLPPA